MAGARRRWERETGGPILVEVLVGPSIVVPMQALASLILGRLDRRGVSYGDVRVILRTSEDIAVGNRECEAAHVSDSYGFGVRVLKNGFWGFAACNDVTTDRIDETVERALLTADAAAYTGGLGETFEAPQCVKGTYTTPFIEDPFKVSMGEKVDLLLRCADIMLEEKTVELARGTMECIRERKFFASTTGSKIEQEIMECGAGIYAYAMKKGEMQVRSYPNSAPGDYAAAGFDFIRAMGLEENSARVAKEVAELLKAPACPAMTTDVILSGNQLALQIHESIGHATELDRILGYEASFAGTSFVSTDQIGKLKYAAPIVNVVSDSTAPLGLGTFGFDDDGVPATRDTIISDGILVGVLSSCSTAPTIKRSSNATMRADGWSNFPLIRMTNLNLLPGEQSLEGLIADTKNGVLLETNRSWSIDDKRINFQFATEVAREIKNGKPGRVYRNPVYSGVTTRFWNSCDGICGPGDWRMWGVPNCGKGEPVQTAHVGHGCAPARFRKVEVRCA